MKTTMMLVSLSVVVAILATDADAAKRRKKYRSAPVPVTQIEQRDNTVLCDGGMMITADDQIKGCTALINSRLSRERRATAYYNRGNAFVAKSDLSRAIADYTEALTYKNDYAQAYFNRAVAQRISGNMQASIGDYSSAIALTPGDADAFAGRGMSYARLAQYQKAAADFEQALRLKPEHLMALVQRGHHFVRTQQWASALGDYAGALAIQKTNVEALYGRGVARLYSGDVKAGQSDMAQAQAFDAGVVARMTSQGIPPPQIIDTPMAQSRPSWETSRETPQAEPSSSTSQPTASQPVGTPPAASSPPVSGPPVSGGEGAKPASENRGAYPVEAPRPSTQP